MPSSIEAPLQGTYPFLYFDRTPYGPTPLLQRTFCLLDGKIYGNYWAESSYDGALQGTGYIMLGFVGMVADEQIGFFISLSICGEILSGIGATLYIVPCLAIVPMLFKTNY